MSIKIFDLDLLLKLGIKKELLTQLDSHSTKDLLSYAMDNFKNPTLSQTLLGVINMEIRGKKGATYLLSKNLTTPSQLKSLCATDIKELVDDYKFHQDPQIIIKNIKQILVKQQQEKLFVKSNGNKGEYFIDSFSKENPDKL